jgi:uncharacterized damage-inducible protein DinB
MNTIIQGYYPTFEMYQALRNQLMSIITDEDLSFRPGGENPTLGSLCREVGEVEYSYIQTFKTFKEDFSYRNDEPEMESSVQKLIVWYEQLDRDLKATIEALSEDAIQNRKVDRGPDFKVSPLIQLTIYNEALLIFYGKVSVYLKMMGKTLPQQWQAWIV